jgi:hypothetical protein
MGGFTGSVALSISAPSSLSNACFTYTNPSASSTGAVTNGSVTVNTSESACTGTGNKRVATTSVDSRGRFSGTAHGLTRAASGITLASLILLWIPGLRRRRWAAFGAILLLVSLTLAVSGCGSSGGTSATASNSTTSSAAGTYTLTLTGTDRALNLSSTTTFTLTVN